MVESGVDRVPSPWIPIARPSYEALARLAGRFHGALEIFRRRFCQIKLEQIAGTDAFPVTVPPSGKVWWRVTLLGDPALEKSQAFCR
eukprot:4136134-Karenia_brevis.AAC.1